MANPILWSLTQADSAHIELAFASIKSNGLGILDFSFTTNFPKAKRNLDALISSCGATGKVGLKLPIRKLAMFENKLGLLSKTLEKAPSSYLILGLSPNENVKADELDSLVQLLNLPEETNLVFEISTLEQATAVAELNPAAIIGCGHEAGGWVGQDTTFVLAQKLTQNLSIPVFMRGGLGRHSAAACCAVGAAGVILDEQLLLLAESPLTSELQGKLSRVDGRDAVVLGEALPSMFRVITQPEFSAGRKLQEKVNEVEAQAPKDAEEELRALAEEFFGFEDPAQDAFPLGQGIALAKSYAEQYGNIPSLFSAFRAAIKSHPQVAAKHKPLDANSPLATSHGTEFPIVQGPMTRVSDVANFAEAISNSGALPMLALSLLRGPQVKTLLDETSEQLKDAPWGVGILGFVPAELRAEQLAEVRRVKPAYAIIAGGRPDQAAALEEDGIHTYLHVPTAELLAMFIEQGAKRFVFEGRECGGHIGPLSSFVLWEKVIDTLLAKSQDLSDVHVLFAGGIHDSCSAAMVSVLAAPLMERGVKVGVILGTSYLFTKEAVESGAILQEYQDQAVECQSTTNFVSGPGHASRCATTKFADEFKEMRKQLLSEESSTDIIRDKLEALNIGRLRVASKGLRRESTNNGASQLVTVDKETQLNEGLYMMGQVATMREERISMRELHEDIAKGSEEFLEEAELTSNIRVEDDKQPISDIAIIGMSSLLPGAMDPEEYWSNILNKNSAVVEVPDTRWDWRMYYDPERKNSDTCSSKWGGFVDDLHFDALQFGIPPTSLKSIEPAQLIALIAVQKAFDHAKLQPGGFDEENTSVVVGTSGGVSEIGGQLGIRAGLPRILECVPPRTWDRLPEWTEESLPGVLANVLAGRIANRFNLGGINYSLDAACASSLAALDVACCELQRKRSNVALAVGVDNLTGPFGFMAFSALNAMSPNGKCRPFDKKADGIVMSEGYACLVLKRVEDAERDGDKIYAVIRGIGGSSDGKAMSITAPLPKGQMRALERAYKNADISPSTISYLEAHGTGTPVGDASEAETITSTLKSHGANPRSCALGSAKALIGHTKSTAGISGIIKVVHALQHKTLPPHANVDSPLDTFLDQECPAYLPNKPQPWFSSPDHPRRGAVSAFGFGGTNYHTVIEEYQAGTNSAPGGASEWPCELFVFRAENKELLLEQIHSLKAQLVQGATPKLRDLAYSLNLEAAKGEKLPHCLAFVADNLAQLESQLELLGEKLSSEEAPQLPLQIFYTDSLSIEEQPKVGFLFSGQGSQYPGMLREAAIYFDEVRTAIERASTQLKSKYPKLISKFIYPADSYSDEEEQRNKEELLNTHVGQASLAAVEAGLLGVLKKFSINPDALAGHSFGEFSALHASGAITEEQFFALAEARGSCMAKAAKEQPGAMLAVKIKPEALAPYLEKHSDVVLANINAPEQLVISGAEEAIEKIAHELVADGILATKLPVKCAFHSPLFEDAQEPLLKAINSLAFSKPQVPVLSNVSASEYADDTSGIIATLSKHLTSPVRWVEQVRAMYDSGIRVFIEVGPKTVLTNLTKSILEEHAESANHSTVSLDGYGGGMHGMMLAMADLLTKGVPVNLSALYLERNVSALDITNLVEETAEAPLSPGVFIINGAGVFPQGEELPVSVREMPLTADTRQEAEATYFESLKEQALGASPTHTQNGNSVNGHTASAPMQATTQMGTPGMQSAGTFQAPAGTADAVMLSHQETMRQFIQMHERVMMQYLGAPVAASQPTAPAMQPMPMPQMQVAPQMQQMQPQPEPSPAAQQNIAAEPPQQVVVDKAPVEANGNLNGHAELDEPMEELTAEGLEQIILELVADRTGYPVEMLGTDKDLEAELGVDSIKRVEILGALAQKLPGDSSDNLQHGMEDLTKVKSIAKLSEALFTAISQSTTSAAAAQTSSEGAPQPKKPESSESEVPRFVLQGFDAPKANKLCDSLSGTYFLTRDKRGVADALAPLLRALGANPVVIEQDVLGSSEALTELVEKTRAEAESIQGIIHLAGLAEITSSPTLEDWKRCAQVHAKGFFQLIRECAPEFRANSSDDLSKKPRILSASLLGGSFGRTSDAVITGAATAGAGTGLLNTVGNEWKGTNCHAIDFHPDISAGRVADTIVDELLGDGAGLEIGYADENRSVFFPVPGDLQAATEENKVIKPESDWVIMVTGGARGITAAVAEEFASSGAQLLLLGRTDINQDLESDATQGVTDVAQLRMALLNSAKERGETLTPVQIESQLKRLLGVREIKENIAKLEEAGARVSYRSVDVRSAEFGDFIEGIYEEFGRIDAVVHGAGVIEDKYIVDKTDESFARVFDTKVDSAFLLRKHLRPEGLKLIVLFSSVSGRFGSEGQIDYAAANEVMNRLAWEMDSEWPETLVLSINWGPWDSVGMASPAVREKLQQIGIMPITLEAGRRFFSNELRSAAKGTVEVIAGSGPWAREGI